MAQASLGGDLHPRDCEHDRFHLCLRVLMISRSKQWRVREPAAEAVTAFPELSPVLGQLLWHRGVRSMSEAEAFRSPTFDAVHDPFLFRHMKGAVDRLLTALSSNEVVMIHGDYDADGICGTAMIWSALKEVCMAAEWNAFEEQRVRWYLPDREGDGYGMSHGAVENFHGQGVNMIVTVDCGIANVDEITRAYELGMEVIVVDHHQLPPKCSPLPYTIHPLAPGETYPFQTLAAVGVAFKVACALFTVARERGMDIPVGREKWLLDLVSIATVTDMVPLVGENRVLETYGLQVLNKTRRVGLKALIEAAGLSLGALTEVDVGFRIGPRINAAGRIAKADAALELLLEDDPHRARDRAEALNGLNAERQRLTEASTRRALEAVNDDTPFVAVVDETIRIGIAGLVAGKLAQETSKPSVVMTRVGEHFVGSGRAPSGFQFVQAMETCRTLMVRGGGHPEACGFTLTEECVVPWIAAMTTFAAATSIETEAIREADAELNLNEVTWDLVRGIDAMAPFGMGNGRPTFMARRVQVITAEPVGKTGSHLRLTVASGDKTIRQCIGFGWGSHATRLHLGDTIHLVYAIGVNAWNGRREIQLEVIDLLSCV